MTESDQSKLQDEICDLKISLNLHQDLNRRVVRALGKTFAGPRSRHNIPEEITRLRNERARLLRRPTITEYEALKKANQRLRTLIRQYES